MTETVLITGAGRGLGLELTKLFLGNGRRVLATYRGIAIPDQLRELGRGADAALRALRLEITDGASVTALRNELSGDVIDVLINNAGTTGGDHQDLGDMDYAAWLGAFEVNTVAPFRLAVALLDNLRRSDRPRIVTLSSQMGSLHRKGTGSHAYRTSKAAVNKVMQVLALELAGDGIIVCPVHPGWVRTDMGGPMGEISVNESAAGLVALIESLTPEHSGRFWTWEGMEHPW